MIVETCLLDYEIALSRYPLQVLERVAGVTWAKGSSRGGIDGNLLDSVTWCAGGGLSGESLGL